MRPLFLLSLTCLLLAGCVPATSQPAEDPLRVFVDANASQATAVSAAETAQFYAAQLTATVEAQHATATERAWLMQATQQAAALTSTARVWEATVTADSLSAPPVVTVLPPEQVRPLLKDVLPGIVRDAIEADLLTSPSEGDPS